MDSLSQLVLGASLSVAVMGRRTAVWKAALWGASTAGLVWNTRLLLFSTAYLAWSVVAQAWATAHVQRSLPGQAPVTQVLLV
jgi:hypothetical protein